MRRVRPPGRAPTSAASRAPAPTASVELDTIVASGLLTSEHIAASLGSFAGPKLNRACSSLQVQCSGRHLVWADAPLCLKAGCRVGLHPCHQPVGRSILLGRAQQLQTGAQQLKVVLQGRPDAAPVSSPTREEVAVSEATYAAAGSSPAGQEVACFQVRDAAAVSGPARLEVAVPEV